MDNLEAIYDEQISPLMKQIIAICKEHKIPMFATFEYADGQLCTSAQRETGHPVFNHLFKITECARPEGIHVDDYFFWLMRENQGKPHSSLCLSQLGLPVDGRSAEESQRR